MRITNRQNLVFRGLTEAQLPDLYRRLADLGMAEPGAELARDVVACPGADTCNLAVTQSRGLADDIDRALEDAGLAETGGVRVNISGCTNSCGQHHVADIGWHGAAKTVNGTAYPMYQLHLGGGVDWDGARFGRQVVKVVARRVPDAVARLLALFEAERQDAETPASFYRRVNPKRVVAALGDLVARTPGAGEETDIGEESGFKVAIGEGECAA